MKELVIISGKGGTGKTSLVASLAVLYEGRVVVADCDVDAADLHLVLEPTVDRRIDFIGGSKARVKSGHCTACGKCEELCRFDAIFYDGPGNGRVAKTFRVDSLACEGCGVCAWFCDDDAIEFAPAVCGKWFISRTRCGPMVHARLDAGGENSGKLVTVIRQEAQKIANRDGYDLLLCDGSPGIGCPVIASLTGVHAALIVVEPTASGLHDFRRVAQLIGQMNIPGMLVVNKADLNLELAAEMESVAEKMGLVALGRIPYDSEVTRAQIEGKAVVETSSGPAATAIRDVWKALQCRLDTVDSAPSGPLTQLPVVQEQECSGETSHGG